MVRLGQIDESLAAVVDDWLEAVGDLVESFLGLRLLLLKG